MLDRTANSTKQMQENSSLHTDARAALYTGKMMQETSSLLSTGQM
jgi:hypothetical protein